MLLWEQACTWPDCLPLGGGTSSSGCWDRSLPHRPVSL